MATRKEIQREKLLKIPKRVLVERILEAHERIDKWNELVSDMEVKDTSGRENQNEVTHEMRTTLLDLFTERLPTPRLYD